MKRFFSILLTLAMLMSLHGMLVSATDSSTSAQVEAIKPDTSWYTGAGPYYINDAADLLGLVELTHAKSNGDYSVTKGKVFYITADIDLNPGWTVGDATAPANIWKGIAAFAGMLDAQGHTVRGLYAPAGLSSGPNKDEFGFINRLVTGGSVKNLNLTNGYLVGDSADNLGSVVGALHWGGMKNGEIVIENCNSDLTIVGNTASAFVGGIYGTAWQDGEGTITIRVSNTCYAGKISNDAKPAYMGGFCGRAAWTSGAKKMNAILTDCYYPAGAMYGITGNSTITVNTSPIFVQSSNIEPDSNTYSIRIVSGISSLEADRAGFRVFITYGDGTTLSKNYTTTKVYERIWANGELIAASDLDPNFKYVYTMIVPDIPADSGITVSVVPFCIFNASRAELDGQAYVMYHNGERVTASWRSLLPSYNATPTHTYAVDSDCTMKEYANVTSADFNAFLAELKSKGFVASQENTLGNNQHAMVSNGVVNAYVSYIDSQGILRLYTEPALRANPSDAAAEGGSYTPKLWQLRVDNINARSNGGMSYVWLLSDGTFFLIDGGYNTALEADNLYAFLVKVCREEGIEGKPVITGWYFTHTDGDHIGAIQAFAPRYADRVDVKAFYYHFQTDYTTAFDRATSYWCDAIHYSRLHTGQQIHLPGIDVNVMYTLEDLYKTTFSFSGYSVNNSCAVIRVDLTADNIPQRIMFLGDIQMIASACIMKYYKGNYADLKSDIVQYSHHGYEGASKDLYTAIQAPTVLWPINIVSTQENYGSVCNVFVRWGMATRSSTWTETDPVSGAILSETFPNAYICSSARYCKQMILAGMSEYQEINFPYTPQPYENGSRLPDVNKLYEELKPILVPDESIFTFS